MVVVVIECVNHGQRAGQGPLYWTARLRAQEACVLKVYRLFARDGANHNRHLGIIAVANAHRPCSAKIDALKMLDEGRHEMPTSLLAVANDVDASLGLVAQHQPDRITLAFVKRIAFELPRCPELSRLGQPGWLGQATNDSSLQDRLMHLVTSITKSHTELNISQATLLA